MSYKQLVTPNLDPVVHENGKVLLDWYGWCLATVRAAFNAPYSGPTAWAGWTEYTKQKHEDRDFPKSVYFPIWFNGAGGDGHVAIAFINGSGAMNIWTAPWHHKPYFDTYPSIEALEKGYHVTFAGWSEDIAGQNVITEVTPVVNHPYTIEGITPKQVKLNKDTHLWNLEYDNFTAINDNPQADVIDGTILIVRAILHHNIGYNYYLSDPNTAIGYNVLDCDDYVPPLPDAPIPAPPSTETYDVVKDVDGYLNFSQAVSHTNQQVIVPVGTYSVFNKRFDTTDSTKLIAINLTKTPGKPGAWINPLDNVETPAEPDFAYVPLPEPKIYVAMHDLPVRDLAGIKKTVTMPEYSVTYVAGTFTVNGVEYARPKSAVDKNLWYGIEWIDTSTGSLNLELESEVFTGKTTLAERQVSKTLTTSDRIALAVATGQHLYLKFISFLTKIKKEK